MDHSLELSNLIEVKAVLKEWKKQNPDLYQYAVCKETKRAITQIFGVLNGANPGIIEGRVKA